MKPLPALALIGIVILAGCITPGDGPSSETYSPPRLKYLLLDRYNEDQFFFCDPDYYPVSHGDEQEKAVAIFPSIQNNTEEFRAIVDQKSLQPPYSDESKLTVYREYKKLNAIRFSPVTSSTYRFSLEMETPEGGRKVTGIIRDDGAILEQRVDAAFLTCPICLARGTLIDTPDGPVAVDELEEGMPVWTADTHGCRRIVPVLRTSVMPVPADHQVVHLKLSDGRELYASPGHPTNDNRTLSMIRTGDELDGAAVTQADLVLYGGEFTYDLLPAGDSGSYRANGIPLKSTLL
jgi:Hint domain